ncbi:DNA-binding transcriptional regulator, LysR family [Pseudoxanthomonas sp. GM95]|uniref:LysR family transcriptional regulator n=1 Tax=Pseudoxanthomonas sp. GM95 TaxID=1881043 RepID=UPI0008ABAE92|nr:LysR family transcriptional regulator [Pseudoxanthomonas sp. GM95]SEL11522.1 DNA-binding transcriptional regulator, LysR family [Pseudoxanthomonas sp. GM95]
MARELLRSNQLRLADLEAFCAVAEKLSYVAAARSTGMSASGVTRAIQGVEAVVGHQLVNRSQRGVSLTPAGEAYYRVAKSALRQLSGASETLSQAASDLSGWVRFSAPSLLEAHVLPQALARVALKHPGLHFDVTFTDAFVDPAQSGMDFAIRGAFPLSSNLIGQTLWKYDRFLCASPHYVETHGSPTQPDVLGGHRFLIHTGPRLLRDWHLIRTREGGIVRVHIDATHRVSSGSGVLQLLLAGEGIARLASWVAQPLIDEGRLVRICPGYRVVSSTGKQAEMHAVYQGPTPSAGTKAIIKALRALGSELVLK